MGTIVYTSIDCVHCCMLMFEERPCGSVTTAFDMHAAAPETLEYDPGPHKMQAATLDAPDTKISQPSEHNVRSKQSGRDEWIC